MRVATSGSSIIEKENKEFLGISLGYDYCSEHEWGIKNLKYTLGMPTELTKKNLGIEYRSITKMEEDCILFREFKYKKLSYSILIVMSSWRLQYYENMKLPKDLPEGLDLFEILCEKNGIACAWDEKSFGIIASAENQEKLKELYNALLKKDACIGLFGGGAFENTHLTIAVKSKMPQDVLKDLKENDESSFELKKIDKKLNLKEKAHKAEKRVHCISLNWIDDEEKKELKTKYDVRCWVNGSNSNFGWFTVEQVKKWIKSDKKTVEEVI